MANPNPQVPGPYKKGQSGNPKGYSKARRALKIQGEKFRRALNKLTPKAIAVLDKRLDQGDITAAKIVLDRTTPALKATDKLVKIPALTTASIDQAGEIILQSIGAGKVSPEVGKTLIDLHATLLRSTELNEFAEFLRRMREGEHPLKVARELAQTSQAIAATAVDKQGAAD